jgi:hypothetical protein
MWPDQKVVLGYLIESMPRWYYISAPGAMRYRLNFGRPGLVAMTHAGEQLAGATPLATPVSVNVGGSRAMMVLAGEPWCAGPSTPAVGAYLVANPTIGLPGCVIGVASKASDTQGTAGYTDSGIVVGGLPIYMLVTIQTPYAGVSLGQMPTPLFITVSSQEFADLGLPNSIIRLGDMSILTTPISFVLCVNHAVTNVGWFFGSLEEEADASNPVATQYSQIDLSVSQLLAPATVPASGGGTDVPIGVMRPVLPGTGAGFLEVRNGA